MAKRRRSGVCVYCGQVGPLTRDHVPPEAFFASSPRPTDLITVPACSLCNSTASKDDEYARLVLAMRQDVGGHPQIKSGVLDAAMRSLQRGAGLRRTFLQSMRTFKLRSPAGLHIGQAPGYVPDLERVSRVFNRVVRGLYFHERKQILGADYEVRSWESSGIDWQTLDDDTREAFRATVATLLEKPDHRRGAGAFSYRCAFTMENSRVSAWLLTLYDSIYVVALTAPVGVGPATNDD